VSLDRYHKRGAVCFFLFYVIDTGSTGSRERSGEEPGDCQSTLRPSSDAACADLPVTVGKERNARRGCCVRWALVPVRGALFVRLRIVSVVFSIDFFLL
jgi:hypothetical protein